MMGIYTEIMKTEYPFFSKKVFAGLRSHDSEKLFENFHSKL